MSHKIEELEAALEESLRRQEQLKEVVRVMATKCGLDWDALVFKANKRIEAAERVSQQMEAEAAAKAAKEAGGEPDA